jgi:hypothetical protein
MSPTFQTRIGIMKLGKLGVLSAAMLLAGGMGLATAQSNTSPSEAPGATSGKCWDSASQQIKDSSSAMNQNRTASGAKKPGGVTTGAASTDNSMQGTGSSASRPSAAAGLPDC